MFDFSNFAAELEEIVSSCNNNCREIVNRSSHSMRKLLANRSLINDEYIENIYNGSINQTVYKSEQNGFIVQVFPWENGSQTPIHDHNTWGIMGIYTNCLEVAEFSLYNTEDNVCDLQQSQKYLIEQGDVCYLLSPDEEIHKINNPTDKMSVSIHVYGKTIDEYNIYDMENGEIIHKVV